MPLSWPLSCFAENDANAYSEPPTRRVGAGNRSERWWWDRYDEIAEHQYDLHPQCHRKRQPSCLKSGKEDSQANIVRPTAITPSPRLMAMVEGSNERYPSAR
jgi:hypothetical protein